MELNPDEVRAIIERARAFDAKQEGVDRETGASAGDDAAADILEESPQDAVRDELFDEIDGMNVDQQAELVALMWIGRGDYDAAEFADAFAEAKRRRTGSTADYLLGSPMLGDELAEGLDAVQAREASEAPEGEAPEGEASEG